jgi:hypothetical protein
VLAVSLLFSGKENFREYLITLHEELYDLCKYILG